MKIEEALNEIKRLKKQLSEANFLIALQRKIIKDLNLKLDEKIKECELLSQKKRMAEIEKFVKKNRSFRYYY